MAVTIENPASLLTDAPLKDTEPSVIPAAEVVEYPTSSTLKVLELPPAFQHQATCGHPFVLTKLELPILKPSIVNAWIVAALLTLAPLLLISSLLWIPLTESNTQWLLTLFLGFIQTKSGWNCNPEIDLLIVLSPV